MLVLVTDGVDGATIADALAPGGAGAGSSPTGSSPPHAGATTTTRWSWWCAGPLYTGMTMKTDIHPEYVEAHVRCTCGNEFTTRSTTPEIRVEICSNCHPFYTGKQKLVDTGGRVERFKRRAAKRQR